MLRIHGTCLGGLAGKGSLNRLFGNDRCSLQKGRRKEQNRPAPLHNEFLQNRIASRWTWLCVCVCVHLRSNSWVTNYSSQFLVLKAAPSLRLAKHTGQGKFGLVWTAAPNQTHMKKKWRQNRKKLSPDRKCWESTEHAWAGWLGKAASTGSSGMTAAAFKKAGARNKIGRHPCTMNSSRTTLHPSERDCVSVCVCIYVQTLESLISQFFVLKAAPSLLLAKHTGQGKFGLVWTAAPNQTHMKKMATDWKA